MHMLQGRPGKQEGAISKPEREVEFSGTSSWTSAPWDCKKMSFVCLSLQVCGIFFCKAGLGRLIVDPVTTAAQLGTQAKKMHQCVSF